jgi:hypothetical protein
MTYSPKGPIANRSVRWEEVAQRGTPEQIGCPDIRPLGPTVAQLRNAPKVTQATLAGFLAIVESYYRAVGWLPKEYQGASNVPIPVEVIELIGEKLVGRAQWSREQNDKQAEAARKRDAEWQAKAEAVWRNRPGLKVATVAKIIAPANWDYVRQRIHKPGK